MNIYDIEEHNKQVGNYFFSEDTMRFFKSIVYPTVFHKKYFVTSETQGRGYKREFTIREYNKETGSINTVCDFQGFSTRKSAENYIKKELN